MVVQPIRFAEGGLARREHPGDTAYVADQLYDRASAELGSGFPAATMQVDLGTCLPGDTVTTVDRTSMAVSPEARVPSLDFKLALFAMTILRDWWVTSTEAKRLIRLAIKGIVLHSVRSRRQRGFEVLLRRWVLGPPRHCTEVRQTPPDAVRQFVDASDGRRLVLQNSIGRRDLSASLWRLIVLDRWLGAWKQGTLPLSPEVPARSAPWGR